MRPAVDNTCRIGMTISAHKINRSGGKLGRKMFRTSAHFEVAIEMRRGRHVAYRVTSTAPARSVGRGAVNKIDIVQRKLAARKFVVSGSGFSVTAGIEHAIEREIGALTDYVGKQTPLAVRAGYVTHGAVLDRYIVDRNPHRTRR